MKLFEGDITEEQKKCQTVYFSENGAERQKNKHVLAVEEVVWRKVDSHAPDDGMEDAV